MAIDPDNFMSLKVTELRAELRACGLPCKGLKQELPDRLKEGQRPNRCTVHVRIETNVVIGLE
jgi:hypothetical protein